MPIRKDNSEGVDRFITEIGDFGKSITRVVIALFVLGGAGWIARCVYERNKGYEELPHYILVDKKEAIVGRSIYFIDSNSNPNSDPNLQNVYFKGK